MKLSLKNQHLRLIQVVLMDQSDSHNALMHEREWLIHPSDRELTLQGNLFVIEDTLTEAGWILVKQAPLPHARLISGAADMRVAPCKDTGFIFQMPGPAWQILKYKNGYPGRTRILHNWQRAMRPEAKTHAVPVFLSNTWGDRSRDSRICQDFIMAEIRAGKDLGVDVVQIDDGWQRGVTANSARARELGGVWTGFWNADPCFWEPHPVRFPQGLGPVFKLAREAGIKIGLWFAPDSHNNFANWRKDAELLLGLRKQYGVCHFKLDSIQAKTPAAAKNLDRLLSALRHESQGEIVVDLDITAGIRPGYFGAMECGPLFVENRYTDSHNYWPHQTLRNLWDLARWIDPRRLRMEFLNNSRNQKLYTLDPLAPKKYSPDALFATTMFCNPLGWFEVSSLSKSFVRKVAQLVRVWKKHRDMLFSGDLLPIGKRPDGLVYTGFLSSTKKGGYLLLFREMNAEAHFLLELPGINANTCAWEKLAGTGKITAHGRSLSINIPVKAGYVFVRFERMSVDKALSKNRLRQP